MPKRRKGANSSRRTTNSIVMRDIRARRSGESQSQETRDEGNQQRQLERRETRRFIVNRRRGIDQQRQQALRAFTSDSFLRLAFQYEPDVEYYAHSKVVISPLDKECPNIYSR